MKPLPTAPNAEAKATRVPKDSIAAQQISSRKHSCSSQQTISEQQPGLRKLSSSNQPASPGQHPALRQPPHTSHITNSAQKSSPDPDSSPAQQYVPSEHHSPAQSNYPKRRNLSTDWNSPAQDESPHLQGPSKDWTQNSMTSPLIEHAMSAKRVSPVMRMHSTDRIATARSPEPQIMASNSGRKPLIPEKAASRRQSHGDDRPYQDRERPSTNTRNDERPFEEVVDNNRDNSKEDSDPSGTELPIQAPTADDPPPTAKSPPIVKRVPSHRITVMSTTSEYSGSLDSPVTREVSPELHRNSKGFVPNHHSYGSISFLPMHPLLSPLPDPSDSWAADAEKEFERRTSDPPKAASPVQQIPKPQPIPAPDDSEGAVNTSHPLLLAERHTKFSSRTNPATPRNGRDLPLRHYHSQDALQRPMFSPSDEKEVFVPPKRSSSLVYGQPDRASSAAMNSSLSLPLTTNFSPPPKSSSAAPSPLNVTQTQRSLTPQPTNVLKSSKASIITGPSSAEDSVSTPSAPSDGATPPAIQRSRSSGITHSKSTPNLTAKKPDLDASDSETSAQNGNVKTSATNNTPFYLNPISSAALIDFLASTPPPSPPGNHARSPSDQTGRKNKGAKKDRSGPFSIFPSSQAPGSPGGRAVTALNIPRDGSKTKTAPTVANSSPAENKKGFKKFFGGVGSKKAKVGKSSTTEDLSLVIPEHDRYRTKKRTGKKGESAGANESKKEGEGEGGGGFMGVGKDGVWISRKNFLKT